MRNANQIRSLCIVLTSALSEAIRSDCRLGVKSFSFGLQSRSSNPPQSRPRPKENGESHANTYVATSVRSKRAIDDEPEETERVESELARATIRQLGSICQAVLERRSMRS